ncbi:hypothetical protein N0V94_004867 [Neodidymelliopsis sp. IMI 364377]|nr:hypothetical protein N0V94_004867 [Neodidymelliopsis sp. IMI 364377]
MTSFLQLDGLHVFVTGAAGGIGSAVVQEFLAQGCKVSAHDLRPNPLASTFSPKLQCLQGDISDECSISISISKAAQAFGPINILCANAGVTDESNSYPIWDMPTELWDRTYAVNVRGTYLTIKHFLKSVDNSQKRTGKELENVSIVVTGSECGVFGQAGHVEYASGKAGLQYGLVKTVKNEIVRLNGKARINAVAPGWVDTKLIEGRLDDPREMWREAQATSGFFSAYVGVPRLLKLFRRFGIHDKVTWFVPMHSAESFPKEFAGIVESGAEIGLHGYCHEGAPQLTPTQEREVLEHCITVYQKLIGRKPVGYRAPLYQLRESTVELLEEHSFLYDSSLSHHDSKPYYLPNLPPIKLPTYEAKVSAKNWMKPLPEPSPPTRKTLVEIPSNWYAEDMTPMQFWPHNSNSQGYVDARVIENMWRDKFEWIRTEVEDMHENDIMIFPLVLHPDTSGMAHVIGMIERMITYFKSWGDEVEFCTFEKAAKEWRSKNTVSE